MNELDRDVGDITGIIGETEMPRRKQTVLEDLTEVSGEIFSFIHPLWSVPTAMLAWYLVAKVAPPDNSMLDQLQILFDVLGGLVALAILVGGAIGWRARVNRARFATEKLDLDWVHGLGWREFEERVADIYRGQGYAVEVLGGSGPDGGVDLRMQRDDVVHLVQCKHWKTSKVGVKPIREFFGVMTAEGADQGIFITSGQFTKEAEQFADGKPLEMIGRSGFLHMIRQFQMEVRADEEVDIDVIDDQDKDNNSSPACPRCAARMIRRTAKRGPIAGTKFWGCSRFPACRGTREV